jgi:histidyl-tRNA synthetase
LRIVDKLDKVGPEGVRAMLLEQAGLSEQQAEQCLAIGRINGEEPAALRAEVEALGHSHELLSEGLDELTTVLAGLSGVQPGAVTADLSIARGLDYYTGTVVEGKFRHDPDYPSICSGGRYDNLVEASADEFPGVGVSIGVTRIMALVLGEGMLKATRKTPSCVLVALNNDDERDKSFAIAHALRTRGIPCEVYGKADRFGKQIKYADRKGIPFVWFPAFDASDPDEVKDIRSGEQVTADPTLWDPPATDRYVSLMTVSENWPDM